MYLQCHIVKITIVNNVAESDALKDPARVIFPAYNNAIHIFSYHLVCFASNIKIRQHQVNIDPHIVGYADEVSFI